jgi:hypothetical protein
MQGVKMNQALIGIVSGLVISLLTLGIGWIVTTVVDLDKQLVVVNMKLDTANMILQDLYENKKDK